MTYRPIQVQGIFECPTDDSPACISSYSHRLLLVIYPKTTNTTIHILNFENKSKVMHSVGADAKGIPRLCG
jgi:hypothetical protein